jgi:peptidoglycan/LPS O-acetylase OafA/YrhL
MADFAAKAPFEATKETFLHDRSLLPAAPKKSTGEMLRWSMIIVLGVLFTVAFVALEFQTRASWDGHRDFVVPVTVPLSAVAGVALAALIVRREWAALGLSLALLLVIAALTSVNAVAGIDVEGRDIFRDLLTWTAFVFMVGTLAALVGTLILVELTRPIKAPPPEM